MLRLSRAATVGQVTAFVQELRTMEVFKAPGVAETLDWASALVALDQEAPSLDVIENTLGVILKYQDDIQALSPETLQAILDRARVRAEGVDF